MPDRVLKKVIPGAHLKINTGFLAKHPVEVDRPVPPISGVHQAFR
jgi:hypothetical protein